MPVTLNLSNSIWPNGMDVDSEGYAVFTPLGKNKTIIPTTVIKWPKGNVLMSPFVYQYDKLVGFCDTKAMEVGDATTIVMPYEHIEADFSSIDKGSLQIHAPNATTKKASWKNVGMEIIPDAQYKYKGCKTADDVTSVDSNYQTTDIVNGTWTELLYDLKYNNPTSSYDGGLFYSCKTLENFTSDLSSLTDGIYMFYNCSALELFEGDLSSLTNGNSMFSGCSKLTDFTSDLSTLTNGVWMFNVCSSLTTFTNNLGSLKASNSMFENCSSLTTFTSDLSSLTNGAWMFNGCSSLTDFTSDLKSLIRGNGMFYGCSKLITFTNDLSSLINGNKMFTSCYYLTTFTSDLNSLIAGSLMFYKTNLTPQSVMCIVDSIKDIGAEKKLYEDGIIPYVTETNGSYTPSKGFMSDGRYVYTYNTPSTLTTTIEAETVGFLTIGINVTNDFDTIADQLQAFAEEANYDSWADLKQAFVDKGWNVTWQYGGTNTAIPYDMRGDRVIPCPIYAQLVEVEEDKEQAEYTNEDGSKFYSINWGHDVTNYDDFQQFDSLEEAMVAYGVILNVTETEGE